MMPMPAAAGGGPAKASAPKPIATRANVLETAFISPM
jgi:hypothetical protein